MDEIDVKKLEKMYLEVDAQFVAQARIIDNMREEILHLRQIIEMLITKSSNSSV